MGKNRARWRQYSKEQLQKMADESRSASEFWVKLGYQGNAGGSALKIAIENDLDISHWPRHGEHVPDCEGKIYVKGVKYTKDELQDICNECHSYAEFSTRLGYKGGNKATKHGKRVIVAATLNCDHFTGQAWNKGNFDLSRFRDYTEDPQNKPRTRGFYDALNQMRGHKCENPECGATEHCGKPIPLEIHHKDGNRFNNSLENLELLCPTCHAMTPNYRGRNSLPEEQVSDADFANALRKSTSIKQALDKVGLSTQGSTYARARRLIDEYNIKHLAERDRKLAENRKMTKAERWQKYESEMDECERKMRNTQSSIRRMKSELQKLESISDLLGDIVGYLKNPCDSELKKVIDLLENLSQSDNANKIAVGLHAPCCHHDNKIKASHDVISISKKPDINTLKRLIREHAFEKIGKMYEVSSNAVRKWCRSYHLPDRKQMIDLIPDELWDEVASNWDSYKDEYERLYNIKFGKVVSDDTIIECVVQGLTIKEIVQKTGVNFERVSRLAREAGIKNIQKHSREYLCVELDIRTHSIIDMARYLMEEKLIESTSEKAISKAISDAIKNNDGRYKNFTFRQLK